MIKIAFDPIYAHELPENHRFPMLKYELIPAQLLHEGTCHPEQFFSPKACDQELILWTHDAEYLTKLVNQVEEAVAPAIEEVKEVVEKAAELAPKNETIKKAKEVAKKAPAKKSAKKSK